MNKPRKRSLGRWLVGALLTLVAIALLLLGGLILFEWRPPPLLETSIHGGTADAPPAPAVLEVISFNIGYAGLGKEADFFMDGGKQVRPASSAVVQRNLDGVLAYLGKIDPDLLLLQEVDRKAKRSYGIDQVKAIAETRPSFFRSRANNFWVRYVPVPPRDPIGPVNSGLLALSRFKLSKALRHQLPGDYAWPVRVFHLKRCLHELRFPAPDGKDWVVLHLHLSAFDKGGTLRKQQMTYLKALLLQLEGEGHHVIVGGDWNQAPPGLDGQSFPHQAEIPDWFQLAPEGWTPPGWNWAYDAESPSLRANNEPYVPGRNFVATVDGFLLSPELAVQEVKCVDLGFVHSDHQPVHLRVSLAAAASAPSSAPASAPAAE